MGFSRQEYWSEVPLPSPQTWDDTTLMAESKEELKRLLMKVKEDSEKAGLKLNSRGGMGRRWEGGSKGRGYMYTYGWFMLEFDREQQNSIKQLSFNKNIKFKISTTWEME